MSRSRPKGAGSPVKHYFDWHLKEGKISMWDKEKKKNVFFPKMGFVVLDELNTVAGFCKSANLGIRGTEVRSIKETPITVYIGKQKKATDLYEVLKNSVTGIKYAQAVYVGLVKKDGPMEIAKIIFTGGSFRGWMNFKNGEEEYKEKTYIYGDTTGVGIAGRTDLKSQGSATWYEPLFETFTLSEEQQEEAIALDVTLQSWLDQKETVGEKAQTESQSHEEVEEETPEVEEQEDAQDDDDLPF